MALQAKVIKQKIEGVGNIKKITKTMEMVAASKMRKAVESSMSSRRYADGALEILVHLSQDKDLQHALMTPRPDARKVLFVIVSSNKGLCGGYNVNIARKIAESYRLHPDYEIECITVGKRAEHIARYNNLSIIASFTEFADTANSKDVRALTQVMLDAFLETDTYAKVMVAYTQFIKTMVYQPKIAQLLPVQTESMHMVIDRVKRDKDEILESQKDSIIQSKPYTFEPSPDIIIDSVVPQLLKAVMYQVLLDAYASEHSSRMMAMQSATENAGKLQDELRLTYNKARQAAITQEIAEIAAGADALT
ncbi:ATP synthase F1 subunit gamma [Candidatus Nomurabacteria bacterium]|nr:ATP synthase F1 subunit gamma [Candidatus Nomurabacteria bacterium]